MDEHIFYWLFGIVTGVILWIATKTITQTLVESTEVLIRRFTFRFTFGDWPTKSEHLRKAQEREVVKELQKRAKTYHEINEREAKLLSEVKQGKVDYWPAKKQLAKIRRVQKKREKSYSRAIRAAKFFGFVEEDTGHYISYLVKETPLS